MAKLNFFVVVAAGWLRSWTDRFRNNSGNFFDCFCLLSISFSLTSLCTSSACIFRLQESIDQTFLFGVWVCAFSHQTLNKYDFLAAAYFVLISQKKQRRKSSHLGQTTFGSFARQEAKQTASKLPTFVFDSSSAFYFYWISSLFVKNTELFPFIVQFLLQLPPVQCLVSICVYFTPQWIIIPFLQQICSWFANQYYTCLLLP